VTFAETEYESEHEATTAQRLADAVGLTVGGIGDPDLHDWPPEHLPLVEGAQADDEGRLRVSVERFALDGHDRHDIWSDIRAKALELTEDPTFRLLEEAYAGLLLDGYELDANTIRRIRDAVMGEPMLDHHNVMTSARTVGQRGEFVILADTVSSKRLDRGRIKASIDRLEAAREPIPVHGLTGNIIGQLNTVAHQPGCGLFARGQMHTENAEALDLLRAIKANKVELSFKDENLDLPDHHTRTEARARTANDAQPGTRTAMGNTRPNTRPNPGRSLRGPAQRAGQGRRHGSVRR
jgi:hypothetical protein